jgi:hypoxanthine phosphoribosyltransferase
MTVPDPTAPTIAYPRDEIAAAVARLGAEISAAHPDGVLLVGVLKGCLIFLSDLARHLDIDVEIDLLAISRFAPDSGRVKLLKDIDADISGRAVVMVEVIVDTGLSVGFLAGQLRRRGAASVEICTLLDKDTRRILPLELSYVGFTAPDSYLLGYGLDYEGRYRNLDEIVVGKLEDLERDPDSYVPSLYPR